jgi:hypothetical protein
VRREMKSDLLARNDALLEELASNADLVWYFDEGPRASPRCVTKAFPKAEKNQTTLEAF